MAANSQPSARSVKYSTKRTERPLAVLRKSDALDMLSSATAYCKASGLEVDAANSDGDLHLRIRQAQIEIGADGVTRFVPLPPEAEAGS